MTITKGFLNRKYEFKPTNLIGGLILWILTAYIFYAFFQVYRETIRFCTTQLGSEAFLVLTPKENYIYNLFYAAIASALGYSIALRFMLQSALFQNTGRAKSIIRRTLNIESFNTWSFLLWFGKLGSLLSIWYLIVALQYDLNWLKEFSIMLLLLPLVLFYATWPSFSRLIRTKKMWWFIRITIIFLVMSFGFAFKNFTDYQTNNKKVLSQSIDHVFDLKIPKSQSQQRIWRSLATDIFIVRDTLGEEPAIFFENINNRIDFQDIFDAAAVEQEKASLSILDKPTANLHIDERIPMAQIKPILDEFRKAGLRKILFSTGVKNSLYPANYPGFKYSGIQKTLPRYFPEFEFFLDSAEQIDLRGKAFKLADSFMYRNGSLKNYNRIEIFVDKTYVTLNGQKIDSRDLERVVYGFIKKYSPNYAIILNINDEITYGRYIAYLDMLWTQVDRLRNELSIELYNQPSNNLYRGSDLDTIIKKFPLNVLEWTTEEERLNKLIEKTGNRP